MNFCQVINTNMCLLNTKKDIIGQNMFGEDKFQYFNLKSFQIYVLSETER